MNAASECMAAARMAPMPCVEGCIIAMQVSRRWPAQRRPANWDTALNRPIHRLPPLKVGPVLCLFDCGGGSPDFPGKQKWRKPFFASARARVNLPKLLANYEEIPEIFHWNPRGGQSLGSFIGHNSLSATRNVKPVAGQTKCRRGGPRCRTA